MDNETAKKLLEVLSEEDLLFLAAEASKTKAKDSGTSVPQSDQVLITASQRFYSGNKITGSRKRCYHCGQSLVNDDEHAQALLNETEVK